MKLFPLNLHVCDIWNKADPFHEETSVELHSFYCIIYSLHWHGGTITLELVHLDVSNSGSVSRSHLSTITANNCIGHIPPQRESWFNSELIFFEWLPIPAANVNRFSSGAANLSEIYSDAPTQLDVVMKTPSHHYREGLVVSQDSIWRKANDFTLESLREVYFSETIFAVDWFWWECRWEMRLTYLRRSSACYDVLHKKGQGLSSLRWNRTSNPVLGQSQVAYNVYRDQGIHNLNDRWIIPDNNCRLCVITMSFGYGFGGAYYRLTQSDLSRS